MTLPAGLIEALELLYAPTRLSTPAEYREHRRLIAEQVARESAQTKQTQLPLEGRS